MYKILMFDDDKKVLELETNNDFIIFDILVNIKNAINLYMEDNVEKIRRNIPCSV